MRKLKDISEHAGNPDMHLLQQKIALAGEMKTSIKRALDEWINVQMFLMDDYPVTLKPFDKRLKELRKSMEAYLNCESGSANTDKS